MAQAEINRIVPVPRDKLFEAITSYTDYPKFVDGVSKIEVDRKDEGNAHVTYHLNLIKDIEYIIDIHEDKEAGTIKWSLLESAFLSTNSGTWTLVTSGDGETDVTYSLEVEFKIPVPGFILRKLIKSQLPATVESFVKKAQSL